MPEAKQGLKSRLESGTNFVPGSFRDPSGFLFKRDETLYRQINHSYRENYEYLIKSGRAPKSAYIGEFLQIKPIIGMVSGTGLVESLGRVNGTKKNMIKLTEMVNDYIDTSKPIHLMVHYTDDIKAGEELREYATSQYDCTEVHMTPYSPVMASATGPVVALSFYS